MTPTRSQTVSNNFVFYFIISPINVVNPATIIWFGSKIIRLNAGRLPQSTAHQNLPTSKNINTAFYLIRELFCKSCMRCTERKYHAIKLIKHVICLTWSNIHSVFITKMRQQPIGFSIDIPWNDCLPVIFINFVIRGLLYLTLIPAWISNHMPNKVWDEHYLPIPALPLKFGNG